MCKALTFHSYLRFRAELALAVCFLTSDFYECDIYQDPVVVRIPCYPVQSQVSQSVSESWLSEHYNFGDVIRINSFARGFHGGDDSSRSFLGCDTVYCCGKIPAF
jgi:hypothetical protein